jgi:hypothetical protein
MRRIPRLIVLNGMRPPADLVAEIVTELADTPAPGR